MLKNAEEVINMTQSKYEELKYNDGKTDIEAIKQEIRAKLLEDFNFPYESRFFDIWAT